MKSRLALMSMIVVGILMSGTGATVAVTGLAGDGSSSIAQYGQQVAGDQQSGGSDGDTDVLGETQSGGGGNDVAGSGAVQPAAQEAADGDDGLPFTGLLVIPLLVGGVALTTTGALLRRRLD